MEVVYAPIQSDKDWAWMQARANPILTPNTTGIVAWSDGTVIAMAAFDNWTENSVQMHMAIDNPFVLRHGFLEEIAKYVYTQAKRDIILATVPGDNKKAIRLNKHIGMTVVHNVKDGFKKGVDYLLLELRKPDCRWLMETET